MPPILDPGSKMIVLCFFLGLCKFAHLTMLDLLEGPGFGVQYEVPTLTYGLCWAHVGSFGGSFWREKITPTENFSVGIHFGST